MKPWFSPAVVFSACLLVWCAGCRQQPTPSSELEKAANALASAAPALPASPDAPPTLPLAVQMKHAMDAYKTDKLEDTVTHLQTMRAATAMTPEQRIALNDAMAAVMTDIYARAAKGDARAAQAVKHYERMQTQRR